MVIYSYASFGYEGELVTVEVDLGATTKHQLELFAAALERTHGDCEVRMVLADADPAGWRVIDLARVTRVDVAARELLAGLIDQLTGSGVALMRDVPLLAEITSSVVDAVEIPVIASGGVGNLDHLVEGIILGGADAVLAASIFHFGEFTVPQAKAYMAERGIEVRL